MHEIPENIVDSSPYGVERWTWWRSGHTGSTEWSKVHLEAITHPTNTSSQRYNKRLITMSLCISRDTDSLECTVYLPERLKGAKGTGQEETRRKRGLKKRRKNTWKADESSNPLQKWTSVHMFAWGHTQMDDSGEVSRGWEDPTWETAGLAEQWQFIHHLK